MAAGEKVIPEITVGNQTYKLMDETAREHLVEVKSTTPTSEDNRLWIKEMSAAEEEANTYEVPTIDEFNDLQNAINANTDTIIGGFLDADSFVSFGDYYINNTNGVCSADTRYDSSELIPVVSGDKYLVVGKTDSSSVSICAFYNQGQAFQSSLINKNDYPINVVTIPSDGFIRVCSKKDLSSAAVYHFPNTKDIENNIDILQRELLFTNQQVSYSTIGNYYLNNSNGMANADARYICSDMIPVYKGEKLLIVGFTNSANVGICCLYDGKKTFVSTLIAQNENIGSIVEITQTGFIRVCGMLNRGGIAVFRNQHTITQNLIENNGFLYNPFVDLQADKNGYYDASGNFVEDIGGTYHTYNLKLNTGDMVVIYWRASASVAAVAEFDSTFTTFQKLVQAGFTSQTRMADIVYEAPQETYLVVSSGDGGAAVMYISKGEDLSNPAAYKIEKWHDAMYINGSGAIIASGAQGYMTSALFPLRQGDTLSIHNLLVNKNTTTVGRWDVDRRIADLTADIKEDTAYLTDFQYTAKDRMEYLRISTRSTDGCVAYIIPNDAYSKGGMYFDRLNLKRFLVVGDSYAAGKEIDQRLIWCGIIAREHNMDITNYAVGGKTSDWVRDQIPSMASEADYVGVVCGRNDYNFQIPLAEFRTRIEAICDRLINKYLGAKLFFLTPWHVEEQTEVDVGGQAQTIPLQDYVDTIVDVCAKKSFPCWDASRNSGVFIDNANFRAKFLYNANDVSHLNAAGFRYVAPKIEAFMESL